MNEATEKFIEELKSRPDILGIILFGSWARGNNRPDSDIDLIVVTTDTIMRTSEIKSGQSFELTYVTQDSVLEYWNSHRNHAADVWNVAKILYEKDAVVSNLQKQVAIMLEEKKKPLSEIQLGHAKFDAEDELKGIGYLIETDPISANFILTNKVFNFSKLYFDVHQLWTPAPKQILGKIKELDKNLYEAFAQFYSNDASLKEKLDLAKKISRLILE